MTDSELTQLWNDLDDLRQSCHAETPADNNDQQVTLMLVLTYGLGVPLLLIFLYVGLISR